MHLLLAQVKSPATDIVTCKQSGNQNLRPPTVEIKVVFTNSGSDFTLKQLLGR